MSKHQYAMVIDSSRCIDCKGCVTACAVANQVPAGFHRNWIKAAHLDYAAMRPMGHFQPGGCMHCDKPLCVDACPTGATWKSPETGIVEIDRGLCIGCGNCLGACPYGARYRHPELRVADKCNYCPERRAFGIPPACVDTCPTKARVFGDIGDPDSEAARLLTANQGRALRIINAASDTEPNMYYLGGTAPADWPVEAKLPVPMTIMTGPLMPALTGLAGLAAAGMAVLGVRQYLFCGGKDMHACETEQQRSSGKEE